MAKKNNNDIFSAGQLDLFGNFIDDNSDTTPEEGANVLSESDSRGLPEIESSIPLPSPIESGQVGSILDSDGREIEPGIDDVGIRPGDEGNRSTGIRPSEVHLPTAGAGAGLRHNYSIPSDNSFIVAGTAGKCDANIKAIETLKILEKDSRFANPEEQEILAKYSGWGGIPQVFNPDINDGIWKERQNSIKYLLTNEEYSSARRSTTNAHYTHPDVARFMWDAALKMGYNGGPTLEPASGTGIFFGTRPGHIPVVMHGVEMDAISGRIAQHLYQNASIIISPYESVKMEADKYNLTISNVPFSEIKPYEDRANRTPGLDSSYSLHDFYFLKSLYGTKPGGLVAFITSRYTMDKQDSSIREKIAESADLVAAFRLPNTAFKSIANTEVVTDILFLRKRERGIEMSLATRMFLSTNHTIVFDNGIEHHINDYYGYDTHHDNVFGKQSITGSMYNANEYTVEPGDTPLNTYLKRALDTIPSNILSTSYSVDSPYLDSDNMLESMSNNSIPPGSLHIGPDARLYVANANNKYDLSDLYLNESSNRTSIERLLSMAKLASVTKEAISHHYNDQPMEVSASLAQLNTLYDHHVYKYGFIHAKDNFKLIAQTPEAALLCSLENWDSKKKYARKTAFLGGLSFPKVVHVTHVDNDTDALALSLSRFGSINISYMQSILDKDPSVFIADLAENQLIFPSPEEYLANNRIVYLTSDEYLSGHIRDKLNNTARAVESDPVTFSRNSDALNTVLPPLLGPDDICIRINSPILGTDHIKSFIGELFNIDTYTSRFVVQHLPVNGKYIIDIPSYYYHNELVKTTYGTADMNGIDIVDCLLNSRAIKVMTPVDPSDPTQGSTLDEDGTSAAEAKAELILEAFQKWIWSDQERTDEIVNKYNVEYNSLLERKYVHPARRVDPDSEVRLPGCAFPYPLRPHQADAIWRVVQSNNTMLAHSVGAGKTLEIAASIMESKRLGLRSKSMVVVPDHMIVQWATEFRGAYPNARLLVADDYNWDQLNRRVFVNNIASGNWDAVIIRLSSFGMIPMSNEYQTRFFEEKISEHRAILDTVPRYLKGTRSVKLLEKAIDSYTAKIRELGDTKKDVGIPSFDRLGIDSLYVDEADLFKNLEYYTQMVNVRGLGSSVGSDRAFDLYMKTRYVQSINGCVCFATGTPISNSLVEAYTVQKYLQPDTLARLGISSFDDWARQYADAVTQMELNNNGTGWKPVTRFSKIINVPELVTSLRQVWDVQTPKTLAESKILVPGVNLPYSKIENVSAPSTPLLKSYLNHLADREGRLSGRAEKGADNVLCILTDGRKAAIDMRLIHPAFPDDPNSKLNIAIRDMYDLYKLYDKEKYVTAAFIDKPKSYVLQPGVVSFDASAEIKNKLINMGVPAKQIGLIQDVPSSIGRNAMFNAVNSGDIRIIIGSTQTMGAGTNFQSRLKAIFHIDAPWRPRDIEQQNGRAIRPGNGCGEVIIRNYCTKGSLDTGLWSCLETKAKSISQIMSSSGSDHKVRTMEEEYYGSVKELSIDNPLMQEAVDLDHAIKKYESLKRGHIGEVSRATRAIKNLPNELNEHNAYITRASEDIAMRSEELKGDAFRIELDGKVYDNRKAAGEHLVLKAQQQSAFAKLGHDKEVTIGEYSGIPVVLVVGEPGAIAFSGNTIAKVYAQCKNFRYGVDISATSDPVGLIQSFHHALFSQPDRLRDYNQSQLTAKESTRSSLVLQANAQFAKEKELEHTKTRYKEVMAALDEMKSSTTDDSQLINEAVQWDKIYNMPHDEVAAQANNLSLLVNVEVVKMIHTKTKDNSDLER